MPSCHFGNCRFLPKLFHSHRWWSHYFSRKLVFRMVPESVYLQIHTHIVCNGKRRRENSPSSVVLKLFSFFFFPTEPIILWISSGENQQNYQMWSCCGCNGGLGDKCPSYLVSSISFIFDRYWAVCILSSWVDLKCPYSSNQSLCWGI